MRFVVFLLVTLGACAQTISLPAGGKLIASAQIPGAPGRGVAVWMTKAERLQAGRHDGCLGAKFGDHWHGLASVSLVDWMSKRILQTLAVESDLEIQISVGWKPGFRDFTGEGKAWQFPLARYVNCEELETALIGYDAKRDRMRQYEVEEIEPGERPYRSLWITGLFLRPQSGPGAWKYGFDMGHGADVHLDWDVRFDKARQVFVNRQKVTPWAKR